ncbi:MAG: hypothetical protein ABR968_02015 [Bacteroidales bacterium]|jgi:hypothetical protein
MENTDTCAKTTMKWYHYIATFFAGTFLTNVVPHFINGISGNAFPTPFADPPGKGLSSPMVNVIWALVNLLVGYVLLRVSKTNAKNKLSMIIFFAGIVFISLMLSVSFMDKMAK